MSHRWVHILALTAGLLGAGGFATAQQLSGEGVIDLTPMLNAMPGQSGQGDQTADPEPAEPPAADAAPDSDPAPQESEDEDSAEGAPRSPASLPDYGRAPAPGAEAPPAPVDTVEAAPILLPFTTRPFSQILRISGEGGSARMTVVIDDPGQASELRLAVRSSVNLLPEQSSLTILLNGVEIAERVPDAFEGFEVMTLPTDALQPGENELIVQATHTHRIFCGPEASFQIWTEIDLGQSGLIVPRTAFSASPQGIREALAAQIVSGGGVTVESAGPVAPELLSELGQRLRALIPGAAPTITVRSPYSAATSGSQPELARIALIGGEAPVEELRRGGDGAMVLVLGGPFEPGRLDAWLPQPVPASDLPHMTPGEPLSIEGMEAGTVAFESRYARADIRFTLPEDWLLSASQKAEIDLSYSYAEGLPEGSLMLVKVNDTTVRLLPLFGQGGEALPRLPVGLPARLLHAGANELSFEAIVPGDPPDLPCARLNGPYVQIDSSTALSVPPSPAMDYPTITDALRHLTPEAVQTPPGIDARGLSGRTVAAVQAGFQPLEGSAGGTLTITGLAEMERATLSRIGVTRGVVEQLLAPIGTAAPAAAEPAAGAGSRIRRAFDRIGAWVIEFAMPGDPPLETWLAERQGAALLYLDDPADPLSMTLVLAPGITPRDIAAALSDARFDPYGPSGAAAVLTDGGAWESWRAATQPPRLQEPLSLANFRTVAGNYASWSPALFVAILAGLVVMSVLLGLSFVVRTRGRNKR
ncbi:cellulose biosynthesis cyclic di-GMP-binding regulatory protein BcsB [Pseudoroseicyclus sp. CXY001]|uniref:cellulose biosynthesis cyclic di-GMP-binding regulatory protein BcsB n=1 Tax=Pseudoroseicyclus sp. CXY001 TaxID=3242492 RepID=UPI003570EE78